MKAFRYFWVIFSISVLLLLTACGGTSPSTGNSGDHDVQVTLKEYTVTSSVTAFSPGVAYHFVVVNNGKINHEFMVLPTDMMPGMSMDDMHHMSLAMIDTIAPGETKTVDVTFPSSDAGKTFELSCHLAGHYEAGMKSAITVKS